MKPAHTSTLAAPALSSENDYLRSPLEASAWLAARGISRTVGTLAVLRVRGGGPRYLKIGRDVRYPESGLCEWVAKFSDVLFESTSQRVA